MNVETKQKIQWQPLVELIVVLLTILGSTIPLYLHTDSKLETAMQGIRTDMQGIRSDMHDFHVQIVKLEERYLQTISKENK